MTILPLHFLEGGEKLLKKLWLLLQERGKLTELPPVCFFFFFFFFFDTPPHPTCLLRPGHRAFMGRSRGLDKSYFVLDGKFGELGTSYIWSATWPTFQLFFFFFFNIYSGIMLPNKSFTKNNKINWNRLTLFFC
jgi:hypothetical protein